jgi:uncharacterized protein YhaN
MPLWWFGMLLGTFIIGALMIGMWLLVPDSPLGRNGSMIALIGIGACAFAWVFKYFADDAAAEKLDACQRQMEVVAKQIADAEREKQQVDAELPMTDGSVVLRMQAAERHLAELENVLPVEAQRKQAGGEVANAETRLKQAQREREAVLATWKSKIAALGLPGDLDPQLLLSVTDRYGQLADLEARARHRREDAAARQREHETLLRRIRDLAEEVGCVLKPKAANDNKAKQDANRDAVVDRNQATEVLANPLDQLDHLLTERRRQLGDVQRREELANKAKELKAEEGKHLQTIAGLKRRRAAMFQAGGCEDEQEYRMMAADQHQHALLTQQRDAVSREIIAAIGRHEPEEVFNNLLAPDSIGTLDQMWEQATADLDATGNRLKELAEQRGSHLREQTELAKDRSLAERQLDLSVVEKQLEEAKSDWRRHATVNRVLERIRADYEAHRQPETLAEASRYMAKFTGGQYKRIWTPLSNDILLVDNAAGESLPVDVLSRGTREQLFLSVRMALVANFARRGVNVPMVLDDVLVNFDIERTRRAAEVLSEFAAGGHQLFFFTCHEHMWEMFRKLDGDCRRIPVRRGQPEPVVAPVIVAEPEPVVLEEPIIEPPKPKKKPRPKPARKPEPVAVTSPPLDFYDYPFVERIIEERPAPKPAAVAAAPKVVQVEAPSEFHEYSFDLPSADYAEERPEGEHALAYIVSADDVRGRQARGSRRHHAIPNYLRGDHLEPRRA